ncbi:MAG: TetR-like C-terminal domain-containing protein [Chloroflexota bacterium]
MADILQRAWWFLLEQKKREARRMHRLNKRTGMFIPGVFSVKGKPLPIPSWQDLFPVTCNVMLRKIECQTILEKRNKNEKMYHIKDDPRSIDSAERLYEGLVTLMQDQPFHTIKVKELVEASHVGRTTFYRNFDTIEDVLRLRSDQVFEEMIDAIIAYVEEHGNESHVILLKPVLRYFYTHSEIIELLMQADRLDIAMASFHRAIAPYKARAQAYYSGINDAYVEYATTIRVGMVTNILVQWIETGKQQPPDELADTMAVLIHNMVTLDQLL